LEQGQAEVNEIDQHGRSAMHFAAARGDIAMIQVLRSASSRYFPLSYPAKGKNYEPWGGLS
jgi:ankyrin repeat protein